jgi:glycosyltransferase involved in cell wall biosynthesis
MANRELPFVSVILAVKDGAKFLRESLESVLRQSHAPLEIIVLDDQSIDETRAIVENVDSAKIRYICNDPQLGIAGSRNHGIQLAKGELLAFTSHDDIWLPEKLSRQCECFVRDAGLDVCLSHVRCFVDPNETVPPQSFPKDLIGKDVPGWVIETLVARRSAFERAGFFDETFAQADDTEWYARAQRMGLSILMLPDALVRKRLHAHSVTYGRDRAKTGRRELLEIARRSIAQQRSSDPPAPQKEKS